MPCRYYSDYDIAQMNAAEAKKIQDALDYATRMACTAVRHLSGLGFDFAQDPELAAWKVKHDEMDRKRELAEQAQALRNQRVEARRQVLLAELAPKLDLLTRELDEVNAELQQGHPFHRGVYLVGKHRRITEEIDAVHRYINAEAGKE